MMERVSEQQKAAGSDAQSLEQLRLQIEAHEKEDDSRSVLKLGVGAVTELFVKDDATLEQLREVYRQQQQNLKDGKAVDTSAIQSVMKDDRDTAHLQSEIVHYGSQGLKTAALFMRGRVGLAGTVGLYALDQIRPGDSFKDQMIDTTLGAAKGGLMKGAFHFMGDKPVGIAAKGIGLGVSSRVLEQGLTRQTYLDKSGDFSLSKGLSETVLGTFNKTALAADVVIFGAAHGLLRGANSASLGRIDKSPMLTTMFTGTTFGMSAGATSEIMRQNATGEQFDLGKIVKRSLIQGAVDTLAAAPGGVQADPHVQGRIKDFTRSRVDNMRSQADSLKTSFLNLADSLSMDGGMVPAMASVPSGMRLDVPGARPERVNRPQRDPKLDNIMQMSDGGTSTGSGASIEGLLTTPGAPRPVAERVVEPVAETGGERTAEPVAEAGGGERSLLGIPKPELHAAIKVRSVEERAAFEAFEALAEASVVEGAGLRGKQQLFQFLRQHPELEIPVRQYEGVLFDSVSTGFKPGELTPTQVKERMDIVSLLGEFYKPERPRIFVENKAQYDAFQQAVRIMGGLKVEGSTAVLAKQGLFDFLNSNRDIHDVVRRYGASSNDPRIVTVLDQYFGTKHKLGLDELIAWRANPAQFVAQRLAPQARGPEVVADPAKTTLGGPGTRAVEPAPVEVASEKRVESGELPPVDDAASAGLSALARAKPLSLVGEGGERTGSEYAAVSPGGERRETATPPPPERRDATETAQPVERRDAAELPPVDRPVAPQPVARETIPVSKYVNDLSDPNVSVRATAARVLPAHFDKMTDAQFQAWVAVAPQHIMMAGQVLGRPEVAAMSPATLKRILSPAVAEKAAPEWAAEHVQKHKEQAAQRAATSDRPQRPPRERQDTIQSRLEMLNNALDAFKDSPELGARLVELGAQDRAALEGVIFSIGHPKFGEGYKALLKQVVPHATSIEGVKYLFEFVKARDFDAAFDALQQIRPRPKTTVEEIEARLKAERDATPERPYEEILDEVTARKQEEGSYEATQVVLEADAIQAAERQARQTDLRPEAQRLFEAEQRKANQQYDSIETLVSALISGTYQPPRTPFSGGRNGPGSPGGDRRGPRPGGFGGGNRGQGGGGGNRY